jgi:hypothetical protein
MDISNFEEITAVANEMVRRQKSGDSMFDMIQNMETIMAERKGKATSTSFQHSL